MNLNNDTAWQGVLAWLVIMIVLCLCAVAQCLEPIPQAVTNQLYNVCQVKARAGNTTGHGSGCYIGDNLVVTCAHVVEGNLTCYFPGGHKHGISAKAIKIDRNWDSALIQLSATPKLAKGSQLATGDPRVGDWMYPTGFPGQSKYARITPAQLQRFSHSTHSREPNWVVTTNTVSGGCSGGPIFNARGKVIGNLWGSRSRHPIGVWGVRSSFTRAFLRPWLVKHKQVRYCPDGVCLPQTVPPAPQKIGGKWCPPPTTRPPITRRCDCGNRPGPVGPRGPQGIPGKDGRNGIDGKDGADGRITQEQIELIKAYLWERIKKDPSFKGEDGEDGKPGEVDIDSVVERVIEKMPKTYGIDIVDKDGNVVETLTGTLGGDNIELQPIAVESYDANGVLRDTEHYPYPGPIRLRYNPKVTP